MTRPRAGDNREEKCECGADVGDIHFDRSICPCGSMHYYCGQCGQQIDPCDDDEAA